MMQSTLRLFNSEKRTGGNYDTSSSISLNNDLLIASVIGYSDMSNIQYCVCLECPKQIGTFYFESYPNVSSIGVAIFYKPHDKYYVVRVVVSNIYDTNLVYKILLSDYGYPGLYNIIDSYTVSQLPSVVNTAVGLSIDIDSMILTLSIQNNVINIDLINIFSHDCIVCSMQDRIIYPFAELASIGDGNHSININPGVVLPLVRENNNPWLNNYNQSLAIPSYTHSGSKIVITPNNSIIKASVIYNPILTIPIQLTNSPYIKKSLISQYDIVLDDTELTQYDVILQLSTFNNYYEFIDNSNQLVINNNIFVCDNGLSLKSYWEILPTGYTYSDYCVVTQYDIHFENYGDIQYLNIEYQMV